MVLSLKYLYFFLNIDNRYLICLLFNYRVDFCCKESRMIKVKELIKLKGGSVWHAAPKTSMRAAIQLMTEKNIGALPVLDENRYGWHYFGT